MPARHTPGPWGKITYKTGYTYIIGPKLHETIARMSGNNHLADGDSRANAQLICAAPDLLASLQVLADEYESFVASRLPPEHAHLASKMPDLVKARAVIAYATT